MYNAQHSHPPWHSLILIPLWVIQIVILSTSVIILAILISITTSAPTTATSTSSSVQPWNILTLTTLSLSLLITIIETQIFTHRDLTPKILFWTTMTKLVTLGGTMAYDMAQYAGKWVKLQSLNRAYLGVGAGFVVLVVIALIMTLIYTIVIWRKCKADFDEVYECV
jgi:hypothetical protein